MFIIAVIAVFILISFTVALLLAAVTRDAGLPSILVWAGIYGLCITYLMVYYNAI